MLKVYFLFKQRTPVFMDVIICDGSLARLEQMVYHVYLIFHPFIQVECVLIERNNDPSG